MTTTYTRRVQRIRKYCDEIARARSLHAAFCLLLLSGVLQAQGSVEMFSGSYAGVPPAGPLSTQTVQLLADPAPGTPPSTIVSVTATLSNQQHTGVGTGPGSPVVMFGGRRADGTTNINTTPVFDEMNTVGGPIDSQFSSLANGSAAGISVADNHAFAVYSSIQQWDGLGIPATNSRVYLADLTLTFSTPVSNPHLQLVGLGGFVGPLGYATELTLTTPGLSLTKLQGNLTLAVTPTEINNANATGILTDCTNNTAGCGTVRVNGTNITSVTFQVFIRGDGGAATWSGPDRNEGDFWMLGVSLPFDTTAADVSLGGRVTALNGQGISGARVMLTDQGGNLKMATTNLFGHYRFDGIEAGQTVVVNISSKRHRFAQPTRVVSLADSALDVNFAATN